MWPYLQALWTDQGTFLGVFRGLLAGGGGWLLANPEALSFLPDGTGAALLFLAGFLRSSVQPKE